MRTALLVASALMLPAGLAGAVLPGSVWFMTEATCTVVGPTTCAFPCVAGQPLHAVGVGLPGAEYLMSCGGSTWTCRIEAPVAAPCGTNQGVAFVDDAAGVCRAVNASIALACSARAPLA